MLQNSTIAGRMYYFGENGPPIAVRRVRTDSAHTPSHPHDLTETEHHHDFCELAIVTQGRAFHCLGNRDFPVTAGDVFLLQGRQKHYFHGRDNLDLINVMYAPDDAGLPENELRRMPGYCAMVLLEPAYRRSHRFESRLHLRRIPLAQTAQLAAELEKELAEQRPGFEAAARAKLTELLVFLSRAYTDTETTEAAALLRVGNVIGALENDFSRKWRIDELLNVAHMSRSNFMRVFRRATGQTPIDYLIRLRIQKAMELLTGSDLPVTEVALAIGFEDSNYFTRQFRKATGETPTAFRKTQTTQTG